MIHCLVMDISYMYQSFLICLKGDQAAMINFLLYYTLYIKIHYSTCI